MEPVIVVANDPPPELPEEETGLRVYPNPSSGTLTIEAEPSAQEAVLYDVRGREILRVTLTGGQVEINTRELPSGTYLVLVGIASKRVTLVR